jgi:WD40 repeat protein/DNA-binding winged helix-turn-helix (wHTH) protein
MNHELRLDLENACLWRGSAEIQLPPKVLAVLQYLLKHQGRIVSKDSLLNAIWPDEEIGETALTSTIRDLRHALGDDRREPSYIETRHRLGYRWIGPVPSIIEPDVVIKKQRSRWQDWGEAMLVPGGVPSERGTSTAGFCKGDSLLSGTGRRYANANDIDLFCGRERELATLANWVVDDRCRLVALLGLGGMGKSALSIKFAQQVASEFEYIIWRSVRNAPPLEDLVQDLVNFLSDGRSTKGDLHQLFRCLRDARCLVVLDNVETLLQNSQLVGQYRVGYEGYGELFALVGETSHHSCLILTSREKPAEVAMLEGQALAVKSLQLSGSMAASIALLQARGLVGSSSVQQQLCQRYDCSPLAIEIVSASIQELFDGQIDLFLAEDVGIFGDIDRLLARQFNRMSELEQTIAYWLAINRTWTTVTQLKADIVPRVSKLQLMSALESLSRRSLLERRLGQYSLQPVVMEYVTQRTIEQIERELLSDLLTLERSLLTSHALIMTTASPSIRESQIRSILAPIADRLQTELLSPSAIRQHLQGILRRFAAANTHCAYGAGNIINLARYLSIDLAGWDFSGLSIWHANLQGTTLHGSNFTNCHFAHSVFTQIFAGVLTLAYSPDGTVLAYGDAGGSVHLWQMAEDELLLTLKQHRGWVWSLAWSPDGQILATGGDDQTVILWDARSGEVLRTLAETNAVWAVAWSPDGRTLASGSFDRTVKLWNPETGVCLRTLLGHDDLVAAVAWSPDGSRLASGSLDRRIKLWNAETGVCLQTLLGHDGGVRAVAWSPDGSTLASSGADCTVKIWEIDSGTVLNTLVGHRNLVSALAWSPDGASLVSGGYDRQAIVWDVSTGKPLKVLPGHTSAVWSVDWCPVTSIVATGSYDKTVKLWDVDSPKGTLCERGECVRTLEGSTSGICSVAWSPDDRLLASGGEDNSIRLWDAQTGNCLQTLTGHTNEVWSVAWSADGQWLASGSGDRTIKLWDVQTGKCLKTLSGYDDWVLSVAWCPIDDSRSGEIGDRFVANHPLNRHHSGLRSMETALEHNNWIVAGSSACRRVKLWDTRTGKQLQEFSAHNGFVWSVAWSADGMRLASGSADGRVRIWDRSTGDCLATLSGHTGFIWSVAWSHDRQLLASGSDDRTIVLWDLNTFEPIRTWRGHHEAVRSVAWSPQGTILASGSHDGEIRLWDIASGEILKILRGHRDRIYAVAWSHDGTTLTSSSADETISLWDVATGVCVRTLSAERPYQGTKIAGSIGLTAAQRSTLIALGAIDKFNI